MKDMIKRIREEREGFTLAELLIVVAIIAVLVAIAIPVFNSQLEKSREAVDAANIRAAYAEVTTAALTGDTTSTTADRKDGVSYDSDEWYKEVTIVQTQKDWQDKSIEKIGNTAIDSINIPESPKDKKVKVHMKASDVTATIDEAK